MLWLGDELLEGLLLEELLEGLLEELLEGLLGCGSLGLDALGDSCLQPLISKLRKVIARRVLPIFSPCDGSPWRRVLSRISVLLRFRYAIQLRVSES